MSADGAPSLSSYESDFLLWSQTQANALRRMAAYAAAPADIDWEHVAEEIEDLGKSEYRAARSLTARILEHLFKLSWSSNPAPQNGWKAEIVAFRRDLEVTLTPSMIGKLNAELERLHASAIEAAALQFKDLEPAAAIDVQLRWTLDQIRGV